MLMIAHRCVLGDHLITKPAKCINRQSPVRLLRVVEVLLSCAFGHGDSYL